MDESLVNLHSKRYLAWLQKKARPSLTKAMGIDQLYTTHDLIAGLVGDFWLWQENELAYLLQRAHWEVDPLGDFDPTLQAQTLVTLPRFSPKHTLMVRNRQKSVDHFFPRVRVLYPPLRYCVVSKKGLKAQLTLKTKGMGWVEIKVSPSGSFRLKAKSGAWVRDASTGWLKNLPGKEEAKVPPPESFSLGREAQAAVEAFLWSSEDAPVSSEVLSPQLLKALCTAAIKRLKDLNPVDGEGDSWHERKVLWFHDAMDALLKDCLKEWGDAPDPRACEPYNFFSKMRQDRAMSRSLLKAEGKNAFSWFSQCRAVTLENRPDRLDHRDFEAAYQGILCPIQTPDSEAVGLKCVWALGFDQPAESQHPPLGLNASMVPYFDHNEGIRHLYFAKQLDQSVPVAESDLPLVPAAGDSLALKVIGFYDLPTHRSGGGLGGLNLRTAYLSWMGWNIEDACVLSTTAATRLGIGVGDKICGRHGNKSTVSLVVPEFQMPVFPDGKPAELLLGPLSSLGRKNLGQLFETQVGWLLTLEKLPELGSLFDSRWRELRQSVLAAAAPFSSETTPTLCDDLQGMIDHLRKHPTEKTWVHHDGSVPLTWDDGNSTASVVAGVQYCFVLDHFANEKLHLTGTELGPHHPVTGQPQPHPQSCGFGGGKIGPMDWAALASHGAHSLMRQFLADGKQSWQAVAWYFAAAGIVVRVHEAEGTCRYLFADHEPLPTQGARMEFDLFNEADLQSLGWQPWTEAVSADQQQIHYFDLSSHQIDHPAVPGRILLYLPILPARWRPDERNYQGRLVTHSLTHFLKEAEIAYLSKQPEDLKQALGHLISYGTWSGGEPRPSALQHLEGKQGLIQSGISGRRQPRSARAVIEPDPTLDPQEVLLPAAMKESVGDSRAVLVVRYPALHRYNLLVFRPRFSETSDPVIRISPLWLDAYAADFDGDTMTVFPLCDAEASDIPWATLNQFNHANGSYQARYKKEALFASPGFTPSERTPSEVLRDSLKHHQDGLSRSARATLSPTIHHWQTLATRWSSSLQHEYPVSPQPNPLDQIHGLGIKTDLDLYRATVVQVGPVRHPESSRNNPAEVVGGNFLRGLTRSDFFLNVHTTRKVVLDKKKEVGIFGALYTALFQAAYPLRITAETCTATVPSVTNCQVGAGICAACFGKLHGQPLPVGAFVGLLAAQAIGERGTQLILKAPSNPNATLSAEKVTRTFYRINSRQGEAWERVREQLVELYGSSIDVRWFDVLHRALHGRTLKVAAADPGVRGPWAAFLADRLRSTLRALKDGPLVDPLLDPQVRILLGWSP